MRTILVLAALVCYAVCQQSFQLENGPQWSTNQATYSCQEACALLFGGSPSDWFGSISSSSITRSCYYDGYALPIIEQPDTLKNCALYQPNGCRSAYIRDHGGSHTNYCFQAATTPAPTTPAPTLPPSCNLFDTSKYGSIKPVVTATASGSSITVSVTMNRQTVDNTGTPVYHNLDTKDLDSATCRASADNIVASIGKAWSVSTDGCAVTYTLTQTLAEINSAGVNDNWTPTLDAQGRSITYTVPIYSTYSVNNAGDCYYAGYKTTVSFRTTLSVASTSSDFVTSDNSAKFSFSGLRMTSANNLEVSGNLTPLVPNSELRNITLAKAVGGVTFVTTPSTSCTTYNVACAKTFTTPISAFGADNDIGGQYNTVMDVYEGGVVTRPAVTITYTLSYTIPTDPTVVDSDTIQTANKLYTDNTYTTLRTSSYQSATGSLFIENAITAGSPSIPSGYKLRMTEGYLCCVNYLNTIPVYNPTTNTGGCKDATGKLEQFSFGTEASHPGVIFTPADAANPKRYRLQVALSTAYSTVNHASPMTCEVLLISKLEAPAARRAEANIDQTFVSTSPFSVEANKVLSSANTVAVSFATLFIVLIAML